jgi:hypothetical protein
MDSVPFDLLSYAFLPRNITVIELMNPTPLGPVITAGGLVAGVGGGDFLSFFETS